VHHRGPSRSESSLPGPASPPSHYKFSGQRPSSSESDSDSSKFSASERPLILSCVRGARLGACRASGSQAVSAPTEARRHDVITESLIRTPSPSQRPSHIPLSIHPSPFVPLPRVTPPDGPPTCRRPGAAHAPHSKAAPGLDWSRVGESVPPGFILHSSGTSARDRARARLALHRHN
jgi:hypothetical protein